MRPNKININNLFYIFITSHLIIWTLVPTLTNHNLPLDTIEALAWGSNLDWGFNKHPPASAFFAEVFYKIFGTNDWAYYLLSQIFVVVSFFVVWKFSEEFFSDKIPDAANKPNNNQSMVLLFLNPFQAYKTDNAQKGN